MKNSGQFIWFKAFNNRFLVPQTNDLLNSDSFYTINLTDVKTYKVNSISLSLNNVVTHLFTELNGRVNLGEGALDNMTYEAARIQIIKPKLIKVNNLPFIDRRILPCFEEINQSDRCDFDKIIFDILDLTEEERKEVYWSVCELVKQRLEKARSVKKS